MHKIMKLKENLLEELEGYADKKDLSMEDLTCIKYLSSATDHLCNVVKEAEEEEEYSNRSYRMSRRSYDDGMSRMGYAEDYRNGVEEGRSGRRDAMGRYTSRASYDNGEDFRGAVQKAMMLAPDERARSEIQRAATKLGVG